MPPPLLQRFWNKHRLGSLPRRTPKRLRESVSCSVSASGERPRGAAENGSAGERSRGERAPLAVSKGIV